MAAVGLAQGLALLALYEIASRGSWLSTHAPVLLALLYATIALPFAWYLTEDVVGLSPRRRRVTALVLGLVLALLGACEGWAGADAEGVARPSLPMMACLALGFVGLPLLAHAQRSNRQGVPLRWHWDYAALFQTTWRNAMMLAIAIALTLILWGVLFAGSALMSSIGVDQVLQLLLQPFFFMPVTAVAFGCAMALAVVRADTIVALRRFWLSMNQAFLPLVLLFAAMWAIALPFTGVEPLLKTRQAGFALLWFAALAVNFANAARQDGLTPAPFTLWLRRVLRIAWLSMLPVVGVAALAIWQRIAQYGWSADRVWSVFVLVMAAGYALGYSLSAWPGSQRSATPEQRAGAHRWMWSIDQTNVVMAMVLCAGLIALSSPIADARRIAVASQVERLLRGQTLIEAFDYRYLKSESGRYGRHALQALADGVPGHARAAELSLWAQAAQKNTVPTLEQSSQFNPPDENLRDKWQILPEGTPAQPGLVDALLTHLRTRGRGGEDTKCLETDTTCKLWMVDLDRDGALDLVVVAERRGARTALIYRWQPATKTITRVGTIERLSPAWIAGLLQGQAKLVPSPWPDIEAGGSRGVFVPGD
jgi:hypothetical protein